MTHSKRINHIVLVVLLLTNVIVHIPFISQPTVDTETQYYYAAIAFGDNHFNFFTPTIEERVPLLFILPSFIMKIAPSIIWGRIENLLAASISLVYIYLLGKYVHSSFVGLMAVLLCIFFPMFAVQSVFFTDAMFVTAVFVATIYYFLTKRKKGYLISASLAMLTKESLVLVPVMLFFFTLAVLLFTRRSSVKKGIIGNLYLLFPLSVFVLWSVLNKIFFGYIVYPGHTLTLLRGVRSLWLLPVRVGPYLQQFIQQANGSVLFLVGALLYSTYMYRHPKMLLKEVEVTSLFLLFLVVYLCFLGHFYDIGLRYALFLYPLVFLLFTAAVHKCCSKAFSFSIIITICFIFVLSQWQMAISYSGTIMTEAIDIRFLAQQQYMTKIIKQVTTMDNDTPIYTDHQVAHSMWNPLFKYVSTPSDNIFQIDKYEAAADCPTCLCEQCIYPNNMPRQKKVFLVWNEENDYIRDIMPSYKTPLMTITPDWPKNATDTYIIYEYYNPNP